ncbi:hypothetical protein FRC04_003315 [Tulasnella sp. 424]|nr:hypothetical protein FRC04_003315 [Tulasnella sp. 424]
MYGVETRREAERLISEFRNATSTRDKSSRIHTFNKLWKSASSEGDNPPRKLRGMLHIGLLPLIMESLTSRELVTVETVELQALMLTALERFLRFCSQETPNPWPTHFSQFEASVPEVFVRSFKMIEEKIQERYIIPLQVGLLTTFLMVSEFFGNLDGNPQVIERIDISKILDTLWASGFAHMNPSPGASSARNSLFLGNYLSIVFALDKFVPSWDQTYRPASLTRAIARYGPERITDRIKEVCEDPQTPAKAINFKTIGAMIGLFMGNRAVAVETIKAGFSKTLIRAYWAWLRQTDEKRKGPEAELTKMVFQSICFLLQFSSKTAGHEALLKTTVQDLLDEDFMMIVGKVLVVAQYEEDFVRIVIN